MRRQSAGIVLYRRNGGGEIEVLLVHPGGPFWVKKDAGVWSIPKGEYDEGDDPIACARREFEEETGGTVPDGPLLELGEIQQKGGKWVVAWAVEGDLDAAAVTSNTFECEWPPKSGRFEMFPEVDRAGWFTLEGAKEKLKAAQLPLLERLLELVGETVR